MIPLFSFDDEEFQRNLSKIKEREEKKLKPVTYHRKVIKQKEFKKLRQEYNQPKEQFFILPNGLHVKEIFISGLGKGIVKISIEKVINAIHCECIVISKKQRKRGKR